MKNFLSLVLLICFLSPALKAQQLAPGTDIVGYGYDVFGEYASQKSKKRYCLFKYDNKQEQVIGSTTYLVPEGVIIENISEHNIKTVEGSSVREYAKNQAASVGLEKDGFFFSGSVNASISQSSSGSERYFYYTYRDANTKWRISFDERRMNDLHNILDPIFVEDLKNPNLSPSELFDRYGTHFIASAYLGGRADFNSTSVITSQTSTSDIAVAVKAKFASVTASAELEQSKKNTLSKARTETKLTVTGGNSEYANNISDPVTYEKWADGISGSPVLCDFDKNSLKPIWMFCKNPSRKSALKAEFERMIKANPLPEAISASMQAADEVFFIKNLADGLYIDLSGYHFDAKRKNGTRISMWEKDNREQGLQGIDRFMKIIPHATDPDYVFIQPQHSEAVFDIVGDGSDIGAEVQLYTNNANEKSQMFKLIPVDGKSNTYYIENKTGGLLLTSNGKGKILTMEKNTKAENQQWAFETAGAKDMAPVKDSYTFALRNVKGKRYMDLGGRKDKALKKGGHIKLWDMDHDPDRYVQLKKSTIDGYYYVQHMHSNYVWDIEGAKKTNGSKLQLWTKSSQANQQFKFIYAGSAMTFYIQDRYSGKYIDASNTQIGQNGCPVQIWPKNGGDQQKWKLEPAGPQLFAPQKPIRVKVKASYSDKFWDLSGEEEKGRPLQIYSNTNHKDRYYTIKRSGDSEWVWIEVDGKRVVVASSKIKTNGAKLVSWDAHNGDNQKFAIQPTSRYHCVIRSKGWKALDMNGALIDENGTKIQLWGLHYGPAQQFQLIDADTGKPIDFRDYIK